MNVELTIAIEQLRFRPADRAWFIPVVLDGGLVPDRPIGGGETLRDIHWADLSVDWDVGFQQILNVLRPEPLPSSALQQDEPAVAVVLAIDVLSFSSVYERVAEDGVRRVIRLVRRAFDGALNKHGGEAIRFTGDGMIALFLSASQAINCATVIHRDIREILGGPGRLEVLKGEDGSCRRPRRSRTRDCRGSGRCSSGSDM